MEKSTKLWLTAIAVLGILLTYEQMNSLQPVHFTCQTNGQRDDLYTYQTGFDSLINDHQVRTTVIVHHENGSLEIEAPQKQELKPDCYRW